MFLLRRFAWILGSRLTASLIQALTFIIVARESIPSEFGLFATFIGLALVINPLFDLGLSLYLVKVRAEDKMSPDIRLVIRLYRLLGLGQMSALICVGVAMSAANNIHLFVFIPMAIASAIERQTDLRLGMALSDGDTWKNFTVHIVRRGAALCITLLFIHELSPILSYGIGYVSAAAVGFILSVKFIRVNSRPDSSTSTSLRKILRDSRPYWINSLAAQMRNLDVLIVTMTASPTAAGYYGAIARSVGPLRMFSSSLAAVIFPQAVKDKSSGKRTSSVPMLGVLGTLVFVYAGLAFWAETFVALLLGAQYLPAVDGFRVLLISLIFASLSSLLTALLQADGSERLVSIVSTVTTFLALIGIYTGSSIAGVTGAAIGLAIAYVAQSALMLSFGGSLLFGRK